MTHLTRSTAVVVIAAVAFVDVFAASTAHAVILDFEEFATPSDQNNQSLPFTSKGFSLNNSNQLPIFRDDQPNIPDTGSNTLGINVVDPVLTLSEIAGNPFNLVSMLVAEGRNTTTGFFQYSSQRVFIEGTLVGGSTVSRTFNLDLFAEENDILDFELVTFSGFENLLSVSFTGQGGVANDSFTLDDINVTTTAVPEPSTFVLPTVGIVGFGLRALWKKFCRAC